MPAFRTLNMGAAPPPLPVRKAPLTAMVHTFERRPQPQPFQAYEYAYTTFAAQKHDIAGAGYGFRTGAPLGYGQRPFVALPTVRPVGLPPIAGQMFFTPLSDPSEKA